MIDYDVFWRMDKGDGIYSMNMSPIYHENSNHRNIGGQLTNFFIFTPNPYIYVRAEITWFEAGKYLKDVSTRKDIIFTGITTRLRF